MKCSSRDSDGKILSRRVAIDLQKEIFRKSIHICAALTPFLLRRLFWPTVFLVSLAAVLFVLSEKFRLKGGRIPLITSVTEAAARNRDSGKIVFGPIFLCAGIVMTALLFDKDEFSVGICALALGDGIASVVGKTLGRTRIIGGKSAEGSLACFLAIFLESALWGCGAGLSILLALVGMLVELLPLRDWDNLFIPLAIAAAMRAARNFF